MDKKKITEIRKASTRDFLVAYELRKRLAQVDVDDVVVETTPEENSVARGECARLVRPLDGDIAVGQVRVLSGVKEITYALVARKWDERSWLVIPFSSFSVPATDTELKLKIDGGLGLRVVQLWNARSLLTETVAKSWLVHTLPDEDVADVVSAWRWSVGNGELSDDQLARTGMPIMRRDDPRIAYEDESLANFAKLDAADMAAAERMELIEIIRENLAGRKLSPFKADSAFKSDYALTAGDAEKAVSAECRVDGFDGSVYVRYAPSACSLNIDVFDADGNRSSALDGWSVFGTGPEPLGAVEQASFACTFSVRFDGVLALVNDEGTVFPLTEGV